MSAAIDSGVLHARSADGPAFTVEPLPYPLLVGQLQAGRWSSQVPEELRFEGRLGVPVGESLDEARAGLEHANEQATDDLGPPVEIAWTGGQFASGETAVDELLEIIKRQREWNEQAARKQLVKFFEAMGPADPLTLTARRRLSSLLFS